MKLENQVVSLDLAKRLKELGLVQEIYFYWREKYHTAEHNNGDGSWSKEGIWVGGFNLLAYSKPRMTTADVKWNESDLARLNETEISAFTVAELGEMLPPTLGSHQHPVLRYDLEQYVYDNSRKYGIQCHDYIDGATRMIWSELHNNEADARAKMLIYLIENGLVKA